MRRSRVRSPSAPPFLPSARRPAPPGLPDGLLPGPVLALDVAAEPVACRRTAERTVASCALELAGAAGDREAALGMGLLAVFAGLARALISQVDLVSAFGS